MTGTALWRSTSKGSFWAQSTPFQPCGVPAHSTMIRGTRPACCAVVTNGVTRILQPSMMMNPTEQHYAGAAGKVVMFNIARPEHPEVMSVVDLGPSSGLPHLRLTEDEKRLVVTDYFLVKDFAPGGVVHAESDHKTHVINVHGGRLERDLTFDLDFNCDISTGPARPHGLALFSADD